MKYGRKAKLDKFKSNKMMKKIRYLDDNRFRIDKDAHNNIENYENENEIIYYDEYAYNDVDVSKKRKISDMDVCNKNHYYEPEKITPIVIKYDENMDTTDDATDDTTKIKETTGYFNFIYKIFGY